MDTKQCNCTTENKCANTAEKQYNSQPIPPISLSNELVAYVSWLSRRVDSLLETEAKCGSSSETIREKISDFFSNEISQSEKALTRSIVDGL